MTNLAIATLPFGAPPPDVEALQAEIAREPHNAQLHHALAISLVHRQDLDGAIAAVERAIALDPEEPQAHCSLGQFRLLQHDLDAARNAFEQALALAPDDPDARGQLAVVLLHQGRTGESLQMLSELTARRADVPLLWANLGAARKAAGDLNGAVAAARQALALQPDWVAVRSDLAAILVRTGRFSEALAEQRVLAEQMPESPEVHMSVGATLHMLGDLAGAQAAHERAAELRPDWNGALHNAAVTAFGLGDAERGATLLRRCLELEPDSRNAHFDLGMMCMMLGDYSAGLREYEWRWAKGGETYHRPELKVPLWDGSPLSGRSLLLWCEQGLGDVLQFARFVSRIPKDGGRIVLHAPKRLARLLAACDGVDQVVTDGDWLEADVQFPMLSLPFRMGIDLDSLGDERYLRAPQRCERAERLIPPDGAALNVGCVWASGALYRKHRQRDCNVRSLAALSRVPGVRLFSLQYGLRSPDAEPYREQLMDLSDDLGDFAQTAAFVERLDLVITVDTSMAHLAGALGVPVWLLLQAHPDWRWMRSRADSPWYPSMRIYRQASPGDWSEPLARIERDLDELARTRGCTRPPAPALPPPDEIPETILVKQYGERRTGTNYLRTLLAANYHTEVLMHILGDKHSAPVPFDEYWRDAQSDANPARAFVCRATFSAPSATTTPFDILQVDETMHFAEPISDAHVRGDLRFVISIRDPYAWAVSLGWFLGWAPRGETLPDERAADLSEACAQFNRRYAAWLALAQAAPSRAFFVSYEELLRDPQAVCDRFARAAGLTRRSRTWRHQDETVLPAMWDNDPVPRTGAKADLLNSQEQARSTCLSPDCHDAIAETIDWALVDRILARTISL